VRYLSHCCITSSNDFIVRTDFYIKLGVRRLSHLIKDEYKPSTELFGASHQQPHPRSTATRTLILERLPLFLHEHTHAQARVPYAWLNDSAHFVVRTFGKLVVVKTLVLSDSGGGSGGARMKGRAAGAGAERVVKHQEASAVAFRDGRGPIQLWLAGNGVVDMFECVSYSLRLCSAKGY
jgi:hypothetical protein